jgi:glyoxalase superfamily protein
VSRLKAICVDCVEPWALAHWWADVLDYRVRPHTAEDLEALRAQGVDRPEDDPAIAVDPVDGVGPTVWFNKVPEPKTVKVRIHVDVYGDVAELARRGARVHEHLEHWTVMTDPEGNEFCVFPPDPR